MLDGIDAAALHARVIRVATYARDKIGSGRVSALHLDLAASLARPSRTGIHSSEPWTSSPSNKRSNGTSRTRPIRRHCQSARRLSRAGVRLAELTSPAVHGIRTHALRTLSTSREPATSLLLLSTIHHLLISLFAPTLDDGRSDRAQQLFSLFHVSLFPALLEDAQTPDGGLENQARLADTLLDVVWQIDQEVDSQAFELRQPGKVTDLKKLADLVSTGRKRLANLLKSLVVSLVAVPPSLRWVLPVD